MTSRLDLLLHGCQEEHVPQYVTSTERQERLARLRSSAMEGWEGALMWGEGNYLTRVYAPMVVGLIDIATEAEKLLEHPGNKEVRARMRQGLDEYLRDLDTRKVAEQMERESDDRASKSSADAALAAADAAAMDAG